MQWYTLFQKEMTEHFRNRKWIWVPLVFVLIAVMDPISSYYLPQIIELSGGLPEGTVLEFPDMQPEEVFATSLESLSTYGILILALFTMGTISGEQKSGVNEMILVKPVSYSSYITAKWAAYMLLIFVSLIGGIGLSLYYVYILFGELPLSSVSVVTLLFILWFAMFLGFAIFFNTLWSSPGAVAASTIATYFLFSAVNMVVGGRWLWFPSQIFVHIQSLLLNGKTTSDLWGTTFFMILIIVILITMAIILFRKKAVIH